VGVRWRYANDTSQHRIGSGFEARSTTREVLARIGLTGKLAIVTGGYSGLGLVRGHNLRVGARLCL